MRPLLRERDRLARALERRAPRRAASARRGAGTARSPSTPSGASPSASAARSSAARGPRRTRTCRCRCGRRRPSARGSARASASRARRSRGSPRRSPSDSQTGGAPPPGRRPAPAVAGDLDHAAWPRPSSSDAYRRSSSSVRRTGSMARTGSRSGVRWRRSSCRRWRTASATSPPQRACSRTNSHCGISSAAANALASSSMSRAGQRHGLVDRRAPAEQRLLAASGASPSARARGRS